MPDLVMTLVLLILREMKEEKERRKELRSRFQGNTTSSYFDLNITNIYLHIVLLLKITCSWSLILPPNSFPILQIHSVQAEVLLMKVMKEPPCIFS
jgi:hypothetical protein